MAKTSEEIQRALAYIRDNFDKEEQSVRDRQIRLWKKLEMYWNGYTKIWWSETAHDWRVFNNFGAYDDNLATGYYDKEINVFRAFLETVIAALSTTVPPVYGIPDDAENTADVETAKASTNIGELIYRHTDAQLLWVKALYTYCIQGMVAGYNYTDEDEKYGTVPVASYKDEEQINEMKICPICQMEIPDDMGLHEMEAAEFDPGDDDVAIQGLVQDGLTLCPSCAQRVDPEIKTEKIIITKLVGMNDQPKSRQKLEILGGLYVKIANWAACQEELPYLAYEYETHFTNVYAKYPDLREKFADTQNTKINNSYSGGNQAYERWGRLNPQYYGEFPINTPTCRNWWIRASAFEMISEDAVREKLKKDYPNGVKVVWVNDQFAEACNESLDDHWTVSKNPLSNYVHFDPLGNLLTSIQDITTELISLTLQTIEHGVSQTFADPSVLDFEAYRNTEVVVGGVYPAKPRAGKTLSDGFFMTSTASLSSEVNPFGEKINELGQFVSGAIPALFGGDMGSNSRTAAQQSMSKNAALQRLQTTWKMINVFWKTCFGKMIPAYIKNMLDDERLVKKEYDSYVNVVIRQSQLNGKLGSIEIDSTEELPFNMGAIKDSLMNLLNQNNPEIIAALGSPQNLPIMKKALGLKDFHLPGEEDREKQYEEILSLVKGQPITGAGMDPMSGQPIEMPSIMPEQLVDNHAVEAETCRFWLVGAAGRLAKIDSPEGYKNVLLHMQAHMMMAQPPPMANQEGNSNGNGNPEQQQSGQ